MDDQGERRTGRCTRRPLPVRPGGAGPQPRARHVDRVSMTGRQPPAVLWPTSHDVDAVAAAHRGRSRTRAVKPDPPATTSTI